MAINLNLNHSISREVLEISVVFSRRLFLCVYLSQNMKIRSLKLKLDFFKQPFYYF